MLASRNGGKAPAPCLGGRLQKTQKSFTHLDEHKRPGGFLYCSGWLGQTSLTADSNRGFGMESRLKHGRWQHEPSSSTPSKVYHKVQRPSICINKD